jgi:hypothetical protein
MTFENLPDGWSDRPLTDPALVSDVLDLVVFAKDRAAGAVSFLLCDDEARLVQPFTIGELPATMTQAERVHCVSVMVEGMSHHGAMIVARPATTGSASPPRTWPGAVRRRRPAATMSGYSACTW